MRDAYTPVMMKFMWSIHHCAVCSCSWSPTLMDRSLLTWLTQCLKSVLRLKRTAGRLRWKLVRNSPLMNKLQGFVCTSCDYGLLITELRLQLQSSFSSYIKLHLGACLFRRRRACFELGDFYSGWSYKVVFFFFLKVWSAAALTPATRTWVAPPLWPNRLWIKAWSVKHSSQSPPAQSRFVPPLREMDMWVSAHGSSGELHFHYSNNSLKQSKFNPFFVCFCFPAVKDPWRCWRCGPCKCMRTLHWTVGQVDALSQSVWLLWLHTEKNVS